MAENTIFAYEALKNNEKTAPKALVKLFTRAGETIAASWVNGVAKREQGISYKEIYLVFADNQKITLRIKAPGDVFQVLLNNKKIPLKNQDDERKAVSEIVGIVKANSTKYQKLLARKKVKLPTGIKSTTKRKEETLQEEMNKLDEALAEATKELEKLQGGAK